MKILDQTLNHKRNKDILIVVLIVFASVLIVSTIVGISNKIKQGRYIGREGAINNTIAVSGIGEVYLKPDLATIEFAVNTEASTVSKAMSGNSDKMNAVIKAVKGEGVDEKDLKTTVFSIYPLYNYSSTGKRTLSGYGVRQSLQVKIRDLAKVGQIIQQATDAGTNEAGSLVFTVDNEDQPKEQAREQAIKDAKDKAAKIAGELGVRLIKIISFNESSFSPSLGYDSLKGYGIGGGGAVPEVQGGENKIEVNVTIVYEIY
ncbi:SIMPL domain-containing protein [Patescibacteria group bacterium]|nr:SIMPL domain-containing protein [Patescibacteria group bacterium]